MFIEGCLKKRQAITRVERITAVDLSHIYLLSNRSITLLLPFVIMFVVSCSVWFDVGTYVVTHRDVSGVTLI